MAYIEMIGCEGTVESGTINVTISEHYIGEEIQCRGRGYNVTQVPTTTSLSFSVPSLGKYGVYATKDDIVHTKYVVVTDLDTPVNVSIMYHQDGSTVLPVNDIQTWLSCIGVYDSEYTTLAEVLADEDLLWELLDDTNSIDYLVRSTEWAEDICNDYNAILHIDAYIEATERFMEDETWADAIENSVLHTAESKVPVMTSNTKPSGACFASSEYSSNYAWKAFDDNSSSTYWRASDTTVPSYVGYMFDEPTYISKIKIQFTSTSSYYASKFKVQGSDDGEIWEDLSDLITVESSTAATLTEYNLNDIYKYTYYRVYITALANSDYPARVRHIEFWSPQVSNSLNAGVRDWIHSLPINVQQLDVPYNHYCNIDEVLSDTELLDVLLSEEYGYLAETTKWVDVVSNNDNGMTAIAAHPECFNNLWNYYPEWQEALFNSPYRDYILPNAVPIMTSDTEPSGECFVTDGYTPSNTQKPYRGFDDSEYSYAKLTASSVENYIGYDFGENNSVKVLGFKILVGSSDTSTITTGRTYKIQGSNDKSNWTDLAVFENPTSSTLGKGRKWEGIFQRPQTYRYYRAWFSLPVYSTSSSNYAYVRDFELYVPQTEVPTDKITIKSAPFDTVYYYDEDDNKIILCETDSGGIGFATREDVPVGLNLFYSSVAKDPIYETDFNMLIRVKGNTKVISLVPEFAIYWYGIKTDLYEQCITDNGWSMSQTLSTPREDKYNVRVSYTFTHSSSDIYTAIGSKIPIPNTTLGTRKVCVVYESDTDAGGLIGVNTEKTLNVSTSSSDMENKNYLWASYNGNVCKVKYADSENFYVYVTSIKMSGKYIYIKALWVE